MSAPQPAEETATRVEECERLYLEAYETLQRRHEHWRTVRGDRRDGYATGGADLSAEEMQAHEQLAEADAAYGAAARAFWAAMDRLGPARDAFPGERRA